MAASKTEGVRVVVRCRPISDDEKRAGFTSVVKVRQDRGVVEVFAPSGKSETPRREFTYDAVYGSDSRQQELYDEAFHPLIESVMLGFNGTIFAYGQTGSGKTYTMEGIANDPEKQGVIPFAFEHIMNHIARSQATKRFLVRCSYLEIYQEQVRDLLAKEMKSLKLREHPEHGVFVDGLLTEVCNSVSDLKHYMSIGNKQRSIGATLMNRQSSRSHSIFMITVECEETALDTASVIRVGKLNLVDLAGSEKQSKTGAEGVRQQEASNINLSLSALGNVISALVESLKTKDKETHIPYRDSKLTRLLKDSLGGNSKTVIVANIGPASYNFEETVSTLRFASRAKKIKNVPVVNQDIKDAMLLEYHQEIQRLRATLEERKKKKLEDVGIKSVVEDDNITNDNANEYLVSEEKEKLLQEVKSKEEALEKEKAQKGHLEEKIKELESKLLCGGKNIIDHTNEQQKALEMQRQEIAEQKQREREMHQLLEEQEECALEMRETHSNLQQDIAQTTKRLRKVFSKLQGAKQELHELSELNDRERRECMHTQNELTKELKLKYLIIENFIPADEKNKIRQRIAYDEDEDAFFLLPLSQVAPQVNSRPVSAAGSRRPVSEYARMSSFMGGSPRYKGENILSLELDMPLRTTLDYEGPRVSPKIQAVLDAALNSVDPKEADIDIDASAASLLAQGRIRAERRDKQPKQTRAKSAKSCSSSSSSPTSSFPQARGLVPK
ncbi:kinesin-like protein KIF3B isoform X2 [Neocloeon triangulifer]|uniref:kinesin-like protein KIF3B isoform X2 n=1 Tax=Neocloeon triangulifer TaxID=2078957 RepID=UPI00286FA13D|nr:kinesin-like protein KIF3B isoform X2 [Neocloeon triangulifer]